MTADPTPDGVKSVALEIVDEPPRRNPWRPTVLTKRRFLQICNLVEKGWAISRACTCCSITYSRFRQVVSRSKRLEQRLKEAENTRFQLRYEEALQCIMDAAQHSWTAAG